MWYLQEQTYFPELCTIETHFQQLHGQKRKVYVCANVWFYIHTTLGCRVKIQQVKNESIKHLLSNVAYEFS